MSGSFGGTSRGEAFAGLIAVVAFGGALLATPAALAGGTPGGAPVGALPTTYGGHTFLTVGAPGNRSMLPVERYFNLNPTPVTEQVGRVDYAFRISKLEVTPAQWLPFIQTAWPLWQEFGAFQGSLDAPQWTGQHIFNHSAGAVPDYRINSGPGNENAANRSQTASWRAAALYCNWLVAGRPTGPNVDLNQLRTGAYDIGTFTRNPDGSFNDQMEHTPGATYWIATLDEWTKAAYFDPNRYAPGNPGPYNGGVPGAPAPITGETAGYWLYPYTSQEDPGFGGPPGKGLYGNGSQVAVGSYPDVQSPWGMLDAMGGAAEWSETVRPSISPHLNRYRFVRGGTFFTNDDFHASDGTFSSGAIRIASLVPTPSGAVLGLLSGFIVGGRGRRKR